MDDRPASQEGIEQAMPHAGLSERLAAFVVESRWDEVPEAVRKEARRSILNGFGTALGGCSDQATLRMLETLRPFSGAPSCTVIGHAGRLDMLAAAFLNAVAVNVFDFDDTHEGTIIHPTAPIAPALFAFAEQHDISGAALLHAFVLGVEVECRLGNAISPGHYRRGWHITATCGVFGAAAAVGKLIGLNRQQMVWALGNASAQASGLVETLGSMAKSVGVGNAARSGLVAALMARNGVEGPARPLEGPRGFLKVTSDAPDFDAVVDGLGESWQLQRNMYKPYPCGVVLNPVIDACLDLRADPEFIAESIESISVTGHPLLKERTDRAEVSTGRESQVSAQHAVAVSLLRGSAGVADFNDAAVRDPAVLHLRAKVLPIVADNTAAVDEARIIVRLKDGRQIARRVIEASGSLARPLSDADLERKLRALAAYGCPALDPGPLIERLWALGELTSAGSVMELARP
jgi:2-methylcitrate dehydratase PrpD